MSASAVPTVTLNNGVEIPQLGLGVWQVPPDQTEQVVSAAFEIGYRHVDTAQMYGNEAGVGKAVAASGLPRDEVFVTTKVNNNNHGYEPALRSIDRSLELLGLDRVDLLLIHWPLPTNGDMVGTWKALEAAYADGRARAIGVSNFTPHQLRALHEHTVITPAVDQIELHPYLVQREAREFCAEHEIAVEAWSPLAQGDVIGDATIADIARGYERSVSQVVLRWQLQLGNIVFPKSTHRERLQENFELFDFELSEGDMALISALDAGARRGPDPTTFDWIPSS